MFDASFLQIVLFGAVGALLVGPKDLPMVARKFGGLLGKGVGFISRTRNSVQAFVKENQLIEVQQDFERSLQQIRQVQDEVKQGLTSPIAHSYYRQAQTSFAPIREPARARSFVTPSSTQYPIKEEENTRSPLGQPLQASHSAYAAIQLFAHVL
jgi:Sec-independent protein translocase protein TatA